MGIRYRIASGLNRFVGFFGARLGRSDAPRERQYHELKKDYQNRNMLNPKHLPIFIMGISQRSGTNFIHDLLALHPDCATRNPIMAEDYLLKHSDKLIDYGTLLGEFWERTWKIPEPVPAIVASLGAGLMSLIAAANPGKRVITKTPSMYNIGHFRLLFPDAPLLIIVRDGRAVAESAFLSFQRSYESSTRMWAYGAKLIRSFIDSETAQGRTNHLLIRYEDLVRNTSVEMRRILDFLELDVSRYDFHSAENIPVRGSSVHRGTSKDLHWKPVPKTETFSPLNRFSHWSKTMHNRFNWIAAEELKYLGYLPEPVSPRFLDRLVNVGLDVRFKLVSFAKSFWTN